MVQRLLMNGAGQGVEVSTSAGDRMDRAWWTDTWALGVHQSDGDQSVISTGLKGFSGDDASVIVTATGSASDELWQRLSRLGYLVPVPLDMLPPELRMVQSARAFVVTEKGAHPTRLFLLTSVWRTERRRPIEEVGGVVQDLLGLPLPPGRVLGDFRRDLLDRSRWRTVEQGSAVLRFLGPEVLEQARLLERTGSGAWRPTLLAVVIAPFVLDGIMADEAAA